MFLHLLRRMQQINGNAYHLLGLGSFYITAGILLPPTLHPPLSREVAPTPLLNRWRMDVSQVQQFEEFEKLRNFSSLRLNVRRRNSVKFRVKLE